MSPGTLSEVNFVNAISSGKYLLPEYCTAFLLAKDVYLEFSGMSSDDVEDATRTAGNGHFSGSYGPFSAGETLQYNHQTHYTQASSASNGLNIKIPGAQIIGYYTSVIPKFPDE